MRHAFVLFIVSACLCSLTTLKAQENKLPLEVSSLSGRPFQLNVAISERAKNLGFKAKKIETKLLSLLFRHGVDVREGKTSYLCLNLGLMKPEAYDNVAWSCTLRFHQPVARFEPEFWTGHAATWQRESYGLVDPKDLKSVEKVIEEFATEFAVDYLKANPEKVKTVKPDDDGPKGTTGTFWTETKTHKIKTKYLNGKIVKQWKFKKH